VAVTIGGQQAQVVDAGRAPGMPGVYQVTAIVPEGVAGGTIPVTVTVAGQISPGGADGATVTGRLIGPPSSPVGCPGRPLFRVGPPSCKGAIYRVARCLK
jgi:hypothetical protein